MRVGSGCFVKQMLTLKGSTFATVVVALKFVLDANSGEETSLEGRRRASDLVFSDSYCVVDSRTLAPHLQELR